MDRNKDVTPPNGPSSGRIKLTPRAFRRLCTIVQSHFGIHLTPEKESLVINRLHNHVESLGFDCYDAFLDSVEADVSGWSLDVLASLISTNHTYFFREEAHFEFLRTRALPEIEYRLARAG